MQIPDGIAPAACIPITLLEFSFSTVLRYFAQ